MDRPVRIGLAGLEDRRLSAELRALPLQPEVREFGDVYDDTEPLVAFRPQVLVLDGPAPGRPATDLVGAVRVLRALLPGLALIVTAPGAREVELGPFCDRTGAHLLRTPFRSGDLAAALDRALAGGDRPRDEVFLDLARGFADEINNPLMFLMGHLQLLQAQIDPATGQALREQLQSALAGAQRIQGTVDRVRLLAQAAMGPRTQAPIDLHAQLHAAIERQQPRPPLPPVLREPDGADVTVRGDAELLLPALDLLAMVACEVHALDCTVHFALWRLERAVRLRLSIHGTGLDDWRLPRTFEPYYLNHLLRGSSQGLALFVVQTAVHAHGGQATARRLPDGAVAIDLHLPAGD
ncbi:MAG: histidine kinase dimerization/phospho-acceptor domain-containing protein [Planctomycetota bacterium]